MNDLERQITVSILKFIEFYSTHDMDNFSVCYTELKQYFHSFKDITLYVFFKNENLLNNNTLYFLNTILQMEFVSVDSFKEWYSTQYSPEWNTPNKPIF